MWKYSTTNLSSNSRKTSLFLALLIVQSLTFLNVASAVETLSCKAESKYYELPPWPFIPPQEKDPNCAAGIEHCGFESGSPVGETVELPTSLLKGDDLTYYLHSKEVNGSNIYTVRDLTISRVDGAYTVIETEHTVAKIDYVTKILTVKGHCERNDVQRKF